MLKRQPLISILIPSFNHEKYVEQTIRSVWTQAYKQVEIIIVDDCSQDGSVALLRSLQSISPCRMEVLINDKRSGPAASVNKAITLAEGELLALFSSDDYYADNPFSQRVENFVHNPGLQIIYGNGLRLDGNSIQGPVHSEETSHLLTLKAPDILEYLYTHTSPFYLQTALIKKELVLRIGCYDESLLADDWAINTKIFQDLTSHGGTFAYHNEPVFYYRSHPENLHRNISRHTALKLEFINRITPEHLKETARFNILYGTALTALNHGQYAAAFDLFRQSRQNGADLKRTIRFARKLLASATFGSIKRKVEKTCKTLASMKENCA